jgi:hypothetical protein
MQMAQFICLAALHWSDVLVLIGLSYDWLQLRKPEEVIRRLVTFGEACASDVRRLLRTAVGSVNSLPAKLNRVPADVPEKKMAINETMNW